MIRLFSQKGFKMSFYRNILVVDPPPFDISITDINKDGLKQEVSQGLQIPYLSKYEESMEKLREKVKYEGKIIGLNLRPFFSIPTARNNSQDYYYVHYLLDTSSSITTLTHQAICCLFGKKVDDPNIHFNQGIQFSIRGTVIQTNLSNPTPSKKDQKNPPNYHNANVLGQNFLKMFTICKLQQNFKKSNAILELIE